MNLTTSLLVLAAALSFAGCASPGQTYAQQHPELPAKQLEILKTGKIPDGDAVAGMTREQIQLTMKVEPAQYTKVDGQDAWVYVTKKLSTSNISAEANDAAFNHQDNRSRHSLAEGENHAPGDQPTVKTTVYFQGNVATKADVVNGGL
jgi:hypothetical protein